jgi:hypothetical protein
MLLVRIGRQLEGGVHFCSGRIISSDLASSRRVGVRAIGDKQVDRGRWRDTRFRHSAQLPLLVSERPRAGRFRP